MLKSVLHELNDNFGPEDLKKFEAEVASGATFRGEETMVERCPIIARSSFSHLTEYEDAARVVDHNK